MQRSIELPRREAATPLTSAQRAHRRSAQFVRWLRRIHLYVGLWGAALGFLFGATGILMNHRAILAIPVTKVVTRSAQLGLPDVPPATLQTPDGMARWLQRELGFDALQTRVKVEPGRSVVWAGREIEQPARWSFSFASPHKGVNAEYHVGNRFVRVETQDATLVGTLTRLHMAVGVSAFWVLLSDTIAGGLVVLSVTGLLLWTRLRPIRLSAVVVGLGALAVGIVFMWTAV